MDHKRIRVSGGWDRYSGSREQTLPKQKRACRNKQHTLIGIILEIEKLICSFFTVGGNFRKPRDNGAAEEPVASCRCEGFDTAFRSFTVGRRNWLMIDTVSGAKASAIIYSIVETAKANNLNPYYYFDHLLTEIPKLKEYNTPEEEAAAMERLLPW